MKNAVVRDMMCQQYGYEPCNIGVEFIASVGDVYEYEIVHYNYEYPKRFIVKISVEEKKFEGE